MAKLNQAIASEKKQKQPTEDSKNNRRSHWGVHVWKDLKAFILNERKGIFVHNFWREKAQHLTMVNISCAHVLISCIKRHSYTVNDFVL